MRVLIAILLLLPPVASLALFVARHIGRKLRRNGGTLFKHEKKLNVCLYISLAVFTLELMAALAILAFVLDFIAHKERDVEARNIVSRVSVYTSIYEKALDCDRCDAGIPWREDCRPLEVNPVGTELHVLKYSYDPKGGIQCIQVRTPDGVVGWTRNLELLREK